MCWPHVRNLLYWSIKNAKSRKKSFFIFVFVFRDSRAVRLWSRIVLNRKNLPTSSQFFHRRIVIVEMFAARSKIE